MSITQLQQQIKEREAQIATLEAAKGSAASRIQALEAERRKLIVPARTGDNAAKTRVAEIDKECATAQRGIHDDDSAIAQLQEQIEALQEQVAAGEKEARREQLRKSATATAKRARENVRLASSLMESAKTSLDELRELGREAANSELPIPSHGGELAELISSLNGAHFTTRYISHLGKLENLASKLERFADNI